MKEIILCLGIASMAILAIGPVPTSAMYNNICRLFADGVKLRDPFACDSYITCTNSQEVSTKCPSGQLFSVESKKCVASVSDCDDPCAPDLNEVWRADANSCNGYYYCRNGTGTFGICPDVFHFAEDKQECIWPKESKCGSDNYCNVVPNDIKFKDEVACDKYYTCTKGVLKSKACPSGELFDRAGAKCAPNTDVDCDSLPSNICGSGKKIEKNKFVSDTVSCRGYYFCADKKGVPDGNPYWGQCPKGQFFNYKGQSCADAVNIVCDADRCDGRDDLFVNAATNCQTYLICQGGKTVGSRQCPNQRFFDEKIGACTSTVIEYPACV